MRAEVCARIHAATVPLHLQKEAGGPEETCLHSCTSPLPDKHLLVPSSSHPRHPHLQRQGLCLHAFTAPKPYPAFLFYFKSFLIQGSILHTGAKSESSSKSCEAPTRQLPAVVISSALTSALSLWGIFESLRDKHSS